MAVDALVALVAGRLFDRWGFAVLIAVFGLAAVFAPLIFFGTLPLVVVGLALWGAGMAAQESIMRAALADLVPADRRGYGFGMFHTCFGLAWFVGSAAMGVLYDLNVLYVVLFSVAFQLAALPVFVLARRRAGVA